MKILEKNTCKPGNVTVEFTAEEVLYLIGALGDKPGGYDDISGNMYDRLLNHYSWSPVKAIDLHKKHTVNKLPDNWWVDLDRLVRKE